MLEELHVSKGVNLHEHPLPPPPDTLLSIATSSCLHFASAQSGALPRHVQSFNGVALGQQYWARSVSIFSCPSFIEML